jgi:hypothetical protein
MLPCRPFAHLRGRLLSREESSASLGLSRSVPLLTFVHLGKNYAQRAGPPPPDHGECPYAGAR